jgi:coproporphyrinogen III oxidase-like Fe-S oxidoreductase
MPDPFSVYVHLPYCAKRCPYCDFNTYVVHSIPEERYVATLIREAEFSSAQAAWAGRRISTVFFGGGTPSLFAPESVGRILSTFDRLWGIDAGAEITLEANPGSLEGGGE